MIGETPLSSDDIPRFKHFLMDHSEKNEKIKGAIKAQIAHLLIQASFQQQLKEIETNLCELIRNYINKCRLNISNLLRSLLYLWKLILNPFNLC